MRRAKFLLGLLPSVLWAQNTPVDTTKTKTKEIDEVIITGFQKIEKSKITSSVDVVKMKDIEQKAVASIDQMLQGRVPGLLVTPASGTPGQIAPIRLRGTASLSGPTDPLWVIDGMPLEMGDAPKYDAGKDINDLKNYSIAGFNPEDIESITVLKDASATAIYGARAANGVILVTTKSGKKGRMNVNFSASTFVNLRPNFSKLNLMNSNQKVDWELMMASRSDLDNYRKDNGEVARILLANNDWNLFRSGGFSAISEASQREINALRNVNTNWGNLLYRTAINKQYSVSLSGGLDNYAYYASLGYYDEQSTVIGSGFERLNLTFKNDFKINNKIKVGLSIFGTNTKQSSFLSDASGNITPTYYSRSANPYLRPKDENGNYVYDPNVNYMDGDARIPYNYMEEKDNTRYDLNTKSLRGILNLDYKIFKFLEFRSQLGIQYENQKTEKYATEQTYFLRKRRDASKITSGGTTTYIIPKGDYYNISNGNSFEYNFKNILEFSKKINRHDVNLLVGSEIRETKYTSVNSQMYGYNPRQKTSIPLNIPNSEMRNANYLPVVDTEVSNAYASFFGTTSYTFANRYTFFGSVRYDGTNFFGAETNKRWNPIWAASVAWNVKNENFLKDNKTISMFKIRSSYGLQGNIDRNTSPFFTGRYSTAKILNQTENTINDEGAPNSLLRWEKTRTVDVGLDFGLFNNRINFNLDFYHRKGTDLMGVKQLPLETGFNQVNVNWAEVTNKGFEFSLSTINIDREKFRWSTTFNIAANRSNIDQIHDGLSNFYPSGKGYPINAVFGLRSAGLDANGLPQFYDRNGNIVSTVDFYKISDPWGVGYIESEYLANGNFRDLYTYIGDRDPKFYGGITNTFDIGNWDLTISAAFNINKWVVANPPYNFTTVDRGQNNSTDILNAWTPSNTNTTLPRIIGENTVPGQEIVYLWYNNFDSSGSYNHFDSWMKKMSYIRINNIRLGYSLPSSMLHNTGINSLRFYVEGRNMLVFGTNYKGYFDPETYGNLYAQPIQKSIVFGLNVSF